MVLNLKEVDGGDGGDGVDAVDALLDVLAELVGFSVALCVL